MCGEPFSEVINVSLHMSVITQNGESVLIKAAKWGRTEVASLLLKAGANIELQDKVYMQIESERQHLICDSYLFSKKRKIMIVSIRKLVVQSFT